MSQTCYYHPSLPIVATCSQCGIPLCNDCTNRIGAATACKQCAPAVQTRLQNAPTANAYSPQPMPGNLQAPYGGPQTPYGGPQAPYGAPQDLQAPYGSPQAPYGAPDMGGSRYADVAESSGSVPLGLLLGAVIGVVGSIAVLKILFYAHFGLAWLYIGVGYGIGYGIWSQTRRGSVGLAFAAIGIMIASLFIAHLVYAGDILNQARAQGNADPGVTIFDALPVAMSSFSPMHWVCILIGLAACWRGVEQQSS